MSGPQRSSPSATRPSISSVPGHNPPHDLAKLPLWLVWRLVFADGHKKPRKVPYYTNGNPREGTQGTEVDRAQLVTYDDAVACLAGANGYYTGVGFALQPDANIVALDFDDCVLDGRIAPHVEELCAGTYTELSPSGTGVRAFFRGSLMSKKDVKAERGAFPIEVFGHNGFVTFTGNVTETCRLFGWDETLEYLTPAVLQMYRERGWDEAAAPGALSDNPLALLSPTLDITDAQVAETLQMLDPAMQYDDWVKVGMAVHQQTSGRGFDLWHNWSKQSPKYVAASGEKYNRERWESFGRYTGGSHITFAWVMKQASEYRVKNAYAARDEVKARIESCDNEYLLREKICPEIARDERLDHLARETLAAAVQGRLRDFGVRLSISDARALVSERNSGGNSDAVEDSDTADVLNAKVLASLLQGRFLHEHKGRGWRRWIDGAWLPCAMGEEVECAKGLGSHLLGERVRVQDFDTRAAADALKQVGRAMTAPGIEAALRLARSDPRVRASPQQFDADRDVLNTMNGLLHLPSATLHPHAPSQYVTRQCATSYEPTAQCPRWMKFLEDISVGDPEWTDFLWRACGYTLCGSVSEEVMFFLLGRGANGKSVFANVLRRILHTYATAVPASFLCSSKRDGEAATPSLATLPGARLALANEVEAGSRLSAQMVKVACSTEAIAARHNYGDPFTYVPSHKLWVRGNHKPIITDNDEGIWRRIVLIQFDRNFAPEERDMQLEEKLMAEAPGVLAWMVRGYAEYRARGLRATGRIAEATATYRSESDLLGEWMREQTSSGGGLEEVQSSAYSDYQAWCSRQGVRALSKKSFTQGLEERGISAGQQGGGARLRTYRGIRLLPYGAFAQDAQDSASIYESLF